MSQSAPASRSSSAPPIPARHATLRRMATAILKEAKGHRGEAARLMRKRIAEDEPLRNLIVDELLDEEVARVVRSVDREQRGVGPKATVADQATPAAGDRAAEGLRLKGARSYMQMVLMTSEKVLGDATRAELEHEAECLEASSGQQMKTARFLRRIAIRLDTKRRVRDVLQEADLVSLMALAGRAGG